VQTALAEQCLNYGPMASYLVHHLVQNHPHLTDPVNASRTQLLNLQTLDWDPVLLGLFDVPRLPLPTCVPNRHHYGQLFEAPAIPLRLVSGDQATAMYAYGKLQPDTAYLNVGTGAFISRPSGRARIYGRRLLTSVIWHQPGDTEYVLEGTVNGAGSALEWFAEEYAIPNLLQELPHWLSEATQHEALFLNGISGLGAPFWVADFSSRFEGDPDLEARAIAVVESIVFLLQASLDEMLKLASPPEQIQITGGLAHLDGLCQRIADLSGLPVYRPLQCEATGRGIAYLLAGSPAHWPEDNPGDWFKPNKNPALIQAYRNWMELMLQALRGRR
jgi:glycerol kinase